MIVVDPTKRITLGEIKRHPAFTRGLPDGYVVPSPLPLPSLQDPIEPGSVQPQLLKVLRQIGYATDDELAVDLLATGQTMAKVFHYMLTRHVDRVALPWENGRHFDDDSAFGEVLEGTPKELLEPDPPAERVAHVEVSYSLAEKPDWAIGDVVLVSYQQDQVIDSIRTKAPFLMMTLQCIMNDLHYDWFHPDDLSLLVRTTTGEFLVCEAEYVDPEFMKLRVKMEEGPEKLFGAIMKRLTDVLKPDNALMDDSIGDEATQAIPPE
jgi:hypothetical protein